MPDTHCTYRTATSSDMDSLNQIIEQAILTWDLPERVKRLAIPSYRYSALDMKHMQLLVAEDHKTGILGIVAWENADPAEIPQAQDK